MKHGIKDTLTVASTIANASLVGLLALVSIYFYHNL